MNFSRTYTTLDAHTGGEPLRIVTAGAPRIPGATILAKRRWAAEHLEDVRKALLWEPRGHADMYGAFLTEPVTKEADFGVLFMHNEGYSDMCGHGIIALATVAVAQGLVHVNKGETRLGEVRLGIDTPAGFVEAFAEWDGQRVGSARFLNVPSFLYKKDVEVVTTSFGKVTLDLAFGGAFYAYVNGEQLGLEVTPDNYQKLIGLGDEVKKAVLEAVDIRHPLEPDLSRLYGTIIDSKPKSSAATQTNICVFADREVDRSPTGTGTAGRVAQLYGRGQLRLGEELVNESIIGSRFTGKAVKETRVGAFDAVVPEISGRAYILGFNQRVIDPEDEVGKGFFLR